MPGVQRADVILEVDSERHMLFLTVNKLDRMATQPHQVFRAERILGSATRTIHFPKHFEGERCSVTLKDGVLLVMIPRKATAPPASRKVVPLQ